MQHVQLFWVWTEKNNTIFTVSEIQTIDNGLPQPHFQGFFSPQQIAYFKNDPTLDTFIAFLSLHRSINTAYEKNIKCKKPRRQCFFRTFFYNIYLVWIQKLKQPMITIKVMTENWTYYGFQGWLQTEKMFTSRKQSTRMIISYIMWSINIF